MNNQNLDYQNGQINNWSQLLQNIDPSIQNYNFQLINEFILKKYYKSQQNPQQHQHGYISPQNLLLKFIKIINFKQYFKNQYALGCIGNILSQSNNQKIQVSSYKQIENFVQFILKNIIQQNLVQIYPKGHPNTIRHGINYLDTICWFLFQLALFLNNNSLFIPISQYYPIIEYQIHGQYLNKTYLTLVSFLSKCSQLLPSVHYITKLLSLDKIKSSENSNFTIMYQIVTLLDNYLRYSQPINRFDPEENLYLAKDYVKFINLRLKEIGFPPKLKCNLVGLFQSLINSSGQQLLNKLFDYSQTQELARQIFYRCKFVNTKQAAIQSIQCFLVLILSMDFNIIQQNIQPQQIACLLVHSLGPLELVQLRRQILTTIQYLIVRQQHLYKNLFYQQNIIKKIQNLLCEYRNNEVDEVPILMEIILEYFQNYQ